MPLENPEQSSPLEGKEEKRQELLREGRGWEAIRYALETGLPFGDQDIFDAMQAIIDAQDRAEERGDEREFDRLQKQYDHIVTWRMTGIAPE